MRIKEKKIKELPFVHLAVSDWVSWLPAQSKKNTSCVNKKCSHYTIYWKEMVINF